MGKIPPQRTQREAGPALSKDVHGICIVDGLDTDSG